MTPHAYFLLPLGLGLFIFSRKWLYRFVIVSSLFSGTAVFNLGSGEGASGVQVWMYFGSLWLAREAASRLMRANISVRRSLLTPIAWLGAFLLTATLSLVMPLYINGHLQIGSAILSDSSASPLYFSSKNITSLLYLLFGALLALSLAEENSSIEKLETTGRIYLGAGVFVALWGFFQLACPLIGLTYPGFIFNNSVSPGALGYLATFPGLNLLRLSSVTLEPSVLSQALLTVLPLTFPSLFGCRSLFSPRADRNCALLIVGALLASASSSAYGGLFFLGVSSVWLAMRMNMMKRTAVMRRSLITVLLLPAFLFVLYTQVSFVRSVFDLILFAKASGYSGLERLKTVQLASGYFVDYPLLGVGWGSVTSHDLLFKLLANVGLLGFLSFAGMVLWIASRLYRDIRGRRDRLALTQMAWLLAFSVLIFTNAIGGFAYVLGHMWITFGMAIASGIVTSPLAKTSRATPASPRPEGYSQVAQH